MNRLSELAQIQRLHKAHPNNPHYFLEEDERMIDTKCPGCGEFHELPEAEAYSQDRVKRLCDKCKDDFYKGQEETFNG